jgi:aerobic-type carbon monoxide dehydrogenase small subunit (CoxS/CutS family)
VKNDHDRMTGGDREEVESGETISIRFTLNGAPCAVDAPPETTLLQLLRDHLLLTGTKCGCEIGQCGACTVILDGEAVASCLVLAGQVEGLPVETVEGLDDRIARSGEGLHPLQRAFLECDAVACGFCTPGMLMAAKALLDANPSPTRQEIKRAISGNLCRCTGYLPIVEAVEQAAGKMKKSGRQRTDGARGTCRRHG